MDARRPVGERTPTASGPAAVRVPIFEGKTRRFSGRFSITTAKSISTESWSRFSARGISIPPVTTAPSGSESRSSETTWSPLRIESNR